ncbi:MAG: HlyD family efflux transporter periplasmic adaptor subunit, partial [Gammaproteobacteria bacterium]
VQVIIQQLQESRSKLEGLISQQQQLLIKAPFSGTIRDVEPSLHQDRWINKKLPLATIIRPYAAVIEGVMQESDLKRVNVQAPVKFIPDSPEENAILGFVIDIEEANLKVLDLESLASVYGGKVPSTLSQDNKLVPDRSFYRVRMRVSEVENLHVDQDRRGVVHIEAESESLLVRTYKLVASVLIRESGF